MTNEKFEETYKPYSKTIETFNSLFNQRGQEKQGKMMIAILLLAILEILWFLFAAAQTGKGNREFSFLSLWTPALLFFFCLYMIYRQKKDNSDHRIHLLHIEWLRKKILKEFFPEYSYLYENKKVLKETLLQTLQKGISDSIYTISYTGCLLNQNTDLYELAAFDKRKKCLFAGLAIALPEEHIHKDVLNSIAKMYKETTGEKVRMLRENNVQWLFFHGIGFDTLMFETPGDFENFQYPIRPFDAEEFKKNYLILNQLTSILSDTTEKKKEILL